MNTNQILFFSLWFYFFLLCSKVDAQVVASFTSADTVCVGAELLLENESEGGESYYWSFCGLDLESIPEGDSLGRFGLLDLPSYSTIVEEGGEYFAFVTNYNSHSLVRLDFGNSLRNTPQAINVGNFSGIVPTALEGISIHKDDGEWWGYATGGYFTNPALVRYKFGSSIKNIPEAENLGNIGGMSFPHELIIFEEDGEWFGWCVNIDGNFLVRFSFGEHLGNTPTGMNIGSFAGMNSSTGLTTFQQNGEWHMFITNSNSASRSLTRLDFGSSLSNIPTGVDLGYDPNFDNIRDMLIFNQCGNIIGYVLNADTDNITILDFQGDITNNPISYPPPFPLKGLDVPVSFSNIISENNDLHFLISCLGNHSMVRYSLESCNTVAPFSATGFAPPPVVYQEPGEYIIELIVDQGLNSETHFCKTISIIDADLDLGQDTTICKGESIELISNITNTTWPDGSNGNTFSVKESDLYIASADTLVCHLLDSIQVNVVDCQNCLVFPNAFTPDADGHNDGFSPLIGCPLELTDYEFKIFNRWGELVFITKDIQNKWNGTDSKGTALPMDVYIWAAIFSYPDAETGLLRNFKEAGDITLLR